MMILKHFVMLVVKFLSQLKENSVDEMKPYGLVSRSENNDVLGYYFKKDYVRGEYVVVCICICLCI